MTTLMEDVTVIGGVDTHKHTHYAAAIDTHGRLLGHQEFPATSPGYSALNSWLHGYGNVVSIGVESTGSFGAALARELSRNGERVIEVNRPNRIARHMDGKSDRLDAEQIARAVLGETSTAIPKSKTGMVEVIRTLRVTRASAVKARTQAFNTLFGVMIGGPSQLRDELVDLTKRTLVNRCLRLRPETENLLSLASEPERMHLAGTKLSLRDLARRWKSLDEEIKQLSSQIDALVTSAAPDLIQLHGVGTEIAGQFLVTVLQPVPASMPGVGVRITARLRTEISGEGLAQVRRLAPSPPHAGLATGTLRSGSSIRGEDPSRRGKA